MSKTSNIDDIEKREELEESLELRQRLAELGSSFISQRQAAAEAEEFHKYKALFDNISDLAYIFDTHGNILYVNKAFEKLTGHSVDAFTGKSFAPLFDDENLKKAEAVYAATLKGDCPQFELLFKDTGVICEYKSQPIIDKKDNIVGVMGIARDITEYRATEQALRDSEDRYRSLFIESRDVVFISSPAGRFEEVNPAGLELFGYKSKDEFMSLDIDKDLYDDSEARSAFMREMDRYGFVKDFEVTLKRSDGERIIVSITANTVHDDKGRVIAYRGILRDMTGYKQLEQQLIQAQKMEAVGKLTGGIAHDFNNILTTIMGYAGLMQMKISKDDPIMSNLEHILGATERAKKLTKGLLAFSRKQIMELKPVNLNHLLTELEDLLSEVISEDIEFNVMLSEKPLVAMAESVQIEQVLMNLITNAKDAMPSGGVLSVSIEEVEMDHGFIKGHGYGTVGGYACIMVSDSGEGIEKTTIDKIFEPFFTTKDVGKGTGLGLAIVYGIVKQHNGHIDVQSEPGKGTTFKIYLPTVDVVVDDDEEDREEEAMPAMGSETVLVAEDNDELRSLITISLEGYGYTVIEARDGLEAVERFKEHRNVIDLLIFDVIMPRLNGKESFDEIKSISPAVKVIFTSGYTEDILDKKLVMEEGINFLSKPVSPKELLARVRATLDNEQIAVTG
jgi:PAS domain S-box-containing protein